MRRGEGRGVSRTLTLDGPRANEFLPQARD
jgi:hypothetical protein